MKKYFVYLVRCSDQSLYCGITTDLKRRINEHNGLEKKAGSKYTAARRPVVLVYSKEFENRSIASQKEYKIKKLTKKEKEALIN